MKITKMGKFIRIFIISLIWLVPNKCSLLSFSSDFKIYNQIFSISAENIEIEISLIITNKDVDFRAQLGNKRLIMCMHASTYTDKYDDNTQISSKIAKFWYLSFPSHAFEVLIFWRDINILCAREIVHIEVHIDILIIAIYHKRRRSAFRTHIWCWARYNKSMRGSVYVVRIHISLLLINTHI